MLKQAVPAVIGLAAVLGLVAPGGDAGANTATPHTVPLDCSADGGDSRSTYDASVQPGVIVPDAAGWPYSPVTYQAYIANSNAPDFLPCFPEATSMSSTPLTIWCPYGR